MATFTPKCVEEVAGIVSVEGLGYLPAKGPKKTTFVAYVFEVKTNRKSWKIYRRFSEFDNLRKRLKAKKSFPKKGYWLAKTGTKTRRVERRFAQLSTWLETTVTSIRTEAQKLIGDLDRFAGVTKIGAASPMYRTCILWLFLSSQQDNHPVISEESTLKFQRDLVLESPKPEKYPVGVGKHHQMLIRLRSLEHNLMSEFKTSSASFQEWIEQGKRLQASATAGFQRFSKGVSELDLGADQHDERFEFPPPCVSAPAVPFAGCDHLESAKKLLGSVSSTIGEFQDELDVEFDLQTTFAEHQESMTTADTFRLMTLQPEQTKLAGGVAQQQLLILASARIREAQSRLERSFAAAKQSLLAVTEGLPAILCKWVGDEIQSMYPPEATAKDVTRPEEEFFDASSEEEEEEEAATMDSVASNPLSTAPPPLAPVLERRETAPASIETPDDGPFLASSDEEEGGEEEVALPPPRPASIFSRIKRKALPPPPISVAHPIYKCPESQRCLSLAVRFGVAALKGRRASMEDDHVAAWLDGKEFASLLRKTAHASESSCNLEALDSLDSLSAGVFGIYDGHAGGGVSRYLASTLHKELFYQLYTRVMHDSAGGVGRIDQVHLESSAFATCSAVDKRLLDKAERKEEFQGEKLSDAGSTAVLLFLAGRTVSPRSTSFPRLMIAYVGDSEVVLCRGKDFKAHRVCVPLHRPNDPGENERIKSVGGVVSNGRIYGLLSVSRSFGDLDFKTSRGEVRNKFTGDLVSAEPDLRSIPFNDSVHFAVIGCDGLFDVMEPQLVVDHVRASLEEHGDLQKAAQELTAAAVRKYRSMDNVTVMVVAFHQTESATEG